MHKKELSQYPAILTSRLVNNPYTWLLALKNTTRVEIIIKINGENCTNIRAKFFVVVYENSSTNCDDNFNPCGIFESMTSFTPILNQDLEQGKLMAAVNSRK